MKKKILVCLFLLLFGIMPSAGAMHIAEGYLPPGWCIAWGVLCIPFVVWGFRSLQKTIQKNPKTKMLIVMAGAYAFVLSALKIPSIVGSCSHMTGVGFGSILFGPTIMTVLGLIVLIFQAILLAHGGLTTLGANVFSMAIVGPLVAFGIYKLLKKTKVPVAVTVFLSATLSDLLTYVVTAFQMAISMPAAVGGFGANFGKFLVVFAGTQVWLAIAEGLLTVLIYNVISKYEGETLKALN